MNADATPEQDAAIRDVLDTSPAISGFAYVDKLAAYEEFRGLFSDKPELLDSVTPDVMPPSYRIVPADPDSANVAELARQFLYLYEGSLVISTIQANTDAYQGRHGEFRRRAFSARLRFLGR